VIVEAKSLSADSLPGIVILNEEERRLRDYMSMTQGKGFPHLLSKKTFIVNTNSKLIKIIAKLQEKQPEMATELTQHLFELSLLSQKELEQTKAEEVLSRQTSILEKLAALIP
jgi:molecular chaperone HtpG